MDLRIHLVTPLPISIRSIWADWPWTGKRDNRPMYKLKYRIGQMLSRSSVVPGADFAALTAIACFEATVVQGHRGAELVNQLSPARGDW